MTGAKSDRVAWIGRYSLPLILIAFTALAFIYSIATPLFEGPDEIWHFAFADHLANGGGLPVFDVNQPVTFLRDAAHPPLYYWIVASVIAPIDRSDFPAEYHFNLASPKITPNGSSDKPNLLIHTAREDFPYQATALAAHLARLISIALGVLTIIGVWKTAHCLIPDRERLAIGATALAAFVPQFVYGSAIINNDALAAAAGTWTVFALLQLMHERSIRRAIICGLLVGITLLSKIGMIAILPLPVLALLAADSHHRDTAVQRNSKGLWASISSWLKSLQWKQIFVSGLIIYMAAFAIAGWWYLRNWTLYGDPLAWKQWQALTGLGRVPPTLGDFMHDMIGLFGTFWADFSLRVDRAWWWVFGLFAVLALGGYARRALRHDWPLIDWNGWLIAVTWLGLLLVVLIRYAFTVYDVHGRALYPALFTIGMVLVVGLTGWNKIGRRLIIALIGGLVFVNMVVPLGIIAPAYARPIVAGLPNGATRTSIKFGDVELLGYQFDRASVSAGELIDVTSYWRKLPEVSGTTARQAVVSLVQPSGSIYEHTDFILGTDIYPSLYWRADEIVATHLVLATQARVSTISNIVLGVRGASADLIPTDTGVTIDLGRVVIRGPSSCSGLQAIDATFGNQIQLTGYRLKPGYNSSPTLLILCWRSLQPTNIDYTVFIHLIDASGKITPMDGQPLNGNYPTSAWLQGEEVSDVHALAPAASVERRIIGLYRVETGERLTINGTNETELVIVTP